MGIRQFKHPSLSMEILVPNSPARIFLIIVFTLTYWGIASLSLSFTSTQPHIAVIWPLSGLAICIVVILGYQFWPTILIGSFTTNYITNVLGYGDFESITFISGVLGIALSNTFEALLGGWLINKFANGSKCFESTTNTFRFVILGVFVPPLVSACGGTLSLYIFGFITWDKFYYLFLIWYTANVVGILVVVPIIFMLKSPLKIGWNRNRIIEGICILEIFGLIVLASSGLLFSSLLEGWPKAYTVIPVLLWLIFRFYHHGFIFAILVLSITTISSTICGYPVFPADTIEQSLLYLQLFLSMVAIMSLAVISVLTELYNLNNDLAMRVELGTSEINQLLKEKDELISFVAHDLQSPILGLKNLVELIRIRRNFLNSSEGDQLLTEMENTCSKMFKLVTQLLDVSKVENLIEKITFKEEDLSQIVHECVTFHKRFSDNKDIELIVDTIEKPIIIETHHDTVVQILDNLINNAIKFSPTGSNIRIVCQTKKDFATLDIIDHGSGISDFNFNNMYDKFNNIHFQTYTKENTHGLGLFIVQTMVVELQGTLDCRSELGKGTTFSVQLPIKPSLNTR